MRLRFALNHMVAPRASAEALFGMAAELGLDAVEIRNDLAATAIADGTDAAVIRAGAAKHGVRILSINALQRFNDWTSERAAEAQALADYAAASGAESLVLCPVNDWRFRPGERARLDGLRRALSELGAILRGRGIIGLVEPLGFAECSLRSKREAVEAIDATGGGETFRLVHDTFHHALAGESAVFPERTGLVHISGVEENDLPFSGMRDRHRVLVGQHDRLDNVGQIRGLIKGGYSGFFSFEPFAESVHALAEVHSALRQSAAYLSDDLESEAA
ncbi:MAG TPA: TIM barrel protein [Propylenella sp.]